MLLVPPYLRRARQNFQLCKGYNHIITYIAVTFSKLNRNIPSGMQFQTNGICSRFDDYNYLNQLTFFEFLAFNKAP